VKYRFGGPMPVPDGEGGIIRPLDVREFDREPDWGPWEPLGKPEAEPAPVPPAPAAAPVLALPVKQPEGM
jgi:hypothetical protein